MIRVAASALMRARKSVIEALLWQNQKALSNIEFGVLQKTSLTILTAMVMNIFRSIF
jgi:hypothetical protein